MNETTKNLLKAQIKARVCDFLNKYIIEFYTHPDNIVKTEEKE